MFITNVFYQVHWDNFDNMLYWNSHIDHFFPVMLLSSKTIHDSRNISDSLLCLLTLNYELGIILWGNSAFSIYIFRLQKRLLQLLQVLN
jgi:hypothetical protein